MTSEKNPVWGIPEKDEALRLRMARCVGNETTARHSKKGVWHHACTEWTSMIPGYADAPDQVASIFWDDWDPQHPHAVAQASGTPASFMPIAFCPFCGVKLDAPEANDRSVLSAEFHAINLGDKLRLRAVDTAARERIVAEEFRAKLDAADRERARKLIPLITDALGRAADAKKSVALVKQLSSTDHDFGVECASVTELRSYALTLDGNGGEALVHISGVAKLLAEHFAQEGLRVSLWFLFGHDRSRQTTSDDAWLVVSWGKKPLRSGVHENTTGRCFDRHVARRFMTESCSELADCCCPGE